MLKKRIIPCLLFNERTIVKSKQFKDYRMVGDPTTVARVFNVRNSDELIFLDINASKYNKQMNFKVIEDIAKECFMPLTIGGGIKSIRDADKIFKLGADKVSINTQAFLNPKLISDISKKYGSQAVIVSIDVKLEGEKYNIYIRGGTEKVDMELVDYLSLIKKKGAGEILINSIDRDGMLLGYDLNLLKLVLSNTDMPIIFSGGCGSLEHCFEALDKGADAISAASIFYYVGESVISIKNYLKQKKINVRN